MLLSWDPLGGVAQAQADIWRRGSIFPFATSSACCWNRVRHFLVSRAERLQFLEDRIDWISTSHASPWFLRVLARKLFTVNTLFDTHNWLFKILSDFGKYPESFSRVHTDILLTACDNPFPDNCTARDVVPHGVHLIIFILYIYYSFSHQLSLLWMIIIDWQISPVNVYKYVGFSIHQTVELSGTIM